MPGGGGGSGGNVWEEGKILQFQIDQHNICYALVSIRNITFLL